MEPAPTVNGCVGVSSGTAVGEMKHNGLRKRLDVLGFTQPLPLGAVPLVGAILEDLIKTTESFKVHKEELHGLRQEKKAWELGVEAYKCDNTKLLAEVNRLNKELIRGRDQQEAALCESRRRLRNLEMDKKYLEDHLQEMGERYEDLEGKYLDLADPKRKASRKPFISTVRSGCLVPPTGLTPPSKRIPCPCPRCPSYNKRRVDSGQGAAKEVNSLHKDTMSLSDTIALQSKQIEVRDREIERLTAILVHDERSVRALAEDCCYKDIKDLRHILELLQNENRLLKDCAKTERSLIVEIPTKDKGTLTDLKWNHNEIPTTMSASYMGRTQSPIYKSSQTTGVSSEELSSQLKCKDDEISRLQRDLSKCLEEEAMKAKQAELARTLRNRCHLQEMYTSDLRQNQELLNKYNKLNGHSVKTSNNENICLETSSDISHPANDMADLQRQIECIRKELAGLSNFNSGTENITQLQKDLCIKDCEIASLKNRNCLSSASVFNSRNYTSPKYSTLDCIQPKTGTDTNDSIRLERENALLNERLNCLKSERDHLEFKLRTELEKVRMERCTFNNVLDDMKVRLDKMDLENQRLTCLQEPKNSEILKLRNELHALMKSIEQLRCDNIGLKEQNERLRCLTDEQCKALSMEQEKLIRTESQLAETNRKLSEKCAGDNTISEEVQKLRAELSKSHQNYQNLEKENLNLSSQLCDRIESARRFQAELEKSRKDTSQLKQEYEEMTKKYSDQYASMNGQECKQKELAIENETLKKQIESLRQSLLHSNCNNRELAEQLAKAECELAMAKQMLKDSQIRVEEMKRKMQEYMLEVDHVGKLLEQKEKERVGLLNNFKEFQQKGNASISHSDRHCLDEANRRVQALECELMEKDELIMKYKKEAMDSIGRASQIRSELANQCDSKGNAEENATMKKLRFELTLKLESLKNELETLKTLHEGLKKANEKMREEIRALNCEDYPQNVKRLQEILSSNRNDIEHQLKHITVLTKDLNQTRLQLCTITNLLEEERKKYSKCYEQLKMYGHTDTSKQFSNFGTR